MLERFHRIINAVFMNSVVEQVNHDTQLAKDITVPASTATPMCNVKRTQGHRTRYGGMVAVMASNSVP